MMTASLLAASLALSGCAPAGGLVVDGSETVCFWDDLGSASAVFGIGLTNTSDTDLTITDVTLQQQNTVLVSEIAVTSEIPGVAGFGTGRTDDLAHSQLLAWDARTPAVGTAIAAGDRAWLLIVARSGGPPEQRTGFRGVTIEFDGAPWPRATQSDGVFGFGPLDQDCDAGLGEPNG